VSPPTQQGKHPSWCLLALTSIRVDGPRPPPHTHTLTHPKPPVPSPQNIKPISHTPHFIFAKGWTPPRIFYYIWGSSTKTEKRQDNKPQPMYTNNLDDLCLSKVQKESETQEKRFVCEIFRYTYILYLEGENQPWARHFRIFSFRQNTI